MIHKNGMVLFWDGVFSQWYRHTMVIDDITYNTCEQYMMAEKARMFEDQETLDLIMEAVSPLKQKKLGRLVKNFDKTKWDSECRDIVYRGNFAKFSDPTLRKYIFTFPKESIFVEASPYDKIWGIGLHESDKDALDPTKWKGTNWLGEAITKVRNELLVDYCQKCNNPWLDHEFAIPAPYCPSPKPL